MWLITTGPGMMKTDSPEAEQFQILLVPQRVFLGAGRSMEGWGVVVEGARVASVGPLDKLRCSGRRIELPNQTLLPGLIDLHGYLSVDADRPNPMERIYATDFAARAWTAARNLRRDLRSGVTTMRVMGEGDNFDKKVREAIASGLFPGPHLITSGHPIAPTHGHQSHPDGGFDGVEGVRRGVRLNLKQHVDWVKLVLTGGVNSSGPKPTASVYTPEEVYAAVAEAKRMGVPVAAAAFGGDSVLTAMQAGVRTIEHGMMFEDKEIEAVVKHAGYLVLTPSRFFHPDGIEKSARYSPRILKNLMRARETCRAFVPNALKAGMKIVLGTDNNHGGLPDDAAYFVELGADPLTALEAATSRAAEAAFIEDRGFIREGAYADLIAVEGDPLKKIDALKKIRLVMREGIPFDLAPE
jgi:imidazolonepropionase-like amidohydrolase